MIHFLLGLLVATSFFLLWDHTPLFYLWLLDLYTWRYGEDATTNHVLKPLADSRPQEDIDRTVLVVLFPEILGNNNPTQQLFPRIAPHLLHRASPRVRRIWVRRLDGSE